MTYIRTKLVSLRLLKNLIFPMISKFEAIFEVNVCYEEGFLKDLEKSSSTGYSIDFGDKGNSNKLGISGYGKCHHNAQAEVLRETKQLKRN